MITVTPISQSHWKRIPTLFLETDTQKVMKFSKLLENPSPLYDTSLDTVFGYTSPSYGSFNWQLPPERRPIQQIHHLHMKTSQSEYAGASGAFLVGPSRDQSDEAYRWFARFLLEGKVFPELRAILASKDSLKVSPSLITDEATGREIASLVGVLLRADIVNKKTLLEAMKKHNMVNRVGQSSSSGGSSTQSVFLLKEIGDFLKDVKRKEFELIWRRVYNSSK